MNTHIYIALVFVSACLTRSQQMGFGLFNHDMNKDSLLEDRSSQPEKNFLSRVSDVVHNIVPNFVHKSKIGSAMHKIVETVKAPFKKNPDIGASVPDIITRYGYTCETHTVLSQGYLMNIHRIPYPKSGGKISKKAVMLHHGILGSSADWILNGPEKALAYVLADAGYDVWMSNIRGNKYSKTHTTLKSDTEEFWNFSWHDVALHDVPTVIDYILTVKGEGASISYIGHSMGTTILFAMLTLRPEYNEILTSGIALAPVAFMTDVKSPMASMAPIASQLAQVKKFHGTYDFIPKNSLLGKMTKVCNFGHLVPKLCKNIIFSVCGYNEKQFDKNLLPVFLSNLGTGTSWKTAVHFSQEVLAGGNFQQFDYGWEYNRMIYGTALPPSYDLTKITLKITLFWAENDLLSSEKDVELLFEKLPSSTQVYKVRDPEFSHLDYLWAIDAPKLVNEVVINTLSRAHSNVNNVI